MNNLTTQAPWYLYIIETKYHQLYTGITLDWVRRLNEHESNSKKSAKALRGKGPLTLKYLVKLNNKTDALKAEIWVKQHKKLIKQDIIDYKTTIPFEHQPVHFV